MNELPADDGQIRSHAKTKKSAIWPSIRTSSGHRTIYEELLTTKQYIIDMEEPACALLEAEMKHMAGGEALERLMNTYTRLTHEFELENGYAYKSETDRCPQRSGF